MVIYLLSLVLVMSNLKKGATAAPETVVCLKVGSTEENLFFENVFEGRDFDELMDWLSKPH